MDNQEEHIEDRAVETISITCFCGRTTAVAVGEVAYVCHGCSTVQSVNQESYAEIFTEEAITHNTRIDKGRRTR